jgi:signal transduction histidine kinase
LFFPAKYDEDELEIYSAPVGEGVVLQIGKSTDVREDMLERFRDLFSIVLSVSLVVSVLGGMLLANRTLSPVRKLIATIRSIEAGNESARVESKKTGDELDTLTTLFNAMLDRIQRLVLGMRETLDNVAHDLRTPITRFRVIAEMSLQNKQDEQTRREALEEGMEAAEEIQTLLNTLLDISEAESGVMRLNRSEFRLAKLLGEVIDLYELLAEEKNIGITMACPEELTMHADYFRIKRVIANLLDNAIKYTPDGGSVSVEASAEPSWIRIAVQDNGQGMESGEMKRIWDRLYRGDRSRSQRGLGLGLSLVRSIVEAHGGQVSVQSELKGGSRFEVAFPA